MFGDILRRMVTQMTGECPMYVSDHFRDYVFSLSEEDFMALYDACLYRKNKDRYGYASLQEAAAFYEKSIICTKCNRHIISRSKKRISVWTFGSVFWHPMPVCRIKIIPWKVI